MLTLSGIVLVNSISCGFYFEMISARKFYTIYTREMAYCALLERNILLLRLRFGHKGVIDLVWGTERS